MSTKILSWLARTPMSMREAARRWVEFIDRRLSPCTVLHYKYIITRFSDGAPASLTDLRTEHVEQYLMSLTALTNRSINSHLYCLRNFSKWASEHYGIPDVAQKVKKLREGPTRQRVLSQTEYDAILSVCQDGEADIIRWLASTGLRASEMQSLTWQNVTPDQKMLHIVGKGNKPRAVSLNRTCRDILSKYPRGKPSQPINFIKSYSYRNALYRLAERLSKKAGVPVAGPHAYRHFFCQRLVKAGVPIAIISKLLGHASIKTTQIYIHVTGDDLEGATDVLD